MSISEKHIANLLLQIKAIKLEPTKPFTWASGWKSPIYCDNRRTLSFQHVRDAIRDGFTEVIRARFPQTQVVAGVATGAIAHAALVAQALDVPMVYVRSEAKKHGLTNLVEGYLEAGQRVTVIEDLISTGGSSLAAVEALRNMGAEVLGMAAIFTYGFDKAVRNFEQAQCTLYTLSNYETLINEAIASGYVNASQQSILQQWRQSPDTWQPNE